MGPLKGKKIIEIAGIGPGPFAGMMLADMGADVITVDRVDADDIAHVSVDLTRRGKRSVKLDLKSQEGREALLALSKNADALFEGFRPGVMEKLGLGPDDLFTLNPKLVYGRMTGWGQSGPLAQAAGHDINYIALSGALYSNGPDGHPPAPALNLVGDYGGGAMMLVTGILAALIEVQGSGKGQVVDASMVEGSSLLMSLMHSMKASGLWDQSRSNNMLDGGMPAYGVYETSDGHYISLGALEPHFMAEFVRITGLDASWLKNHTKKSAWPTMKQDLAKLFKTKSQADWCDVLEGTDCCFAPILPFWEAHKHPHNMERKSFIEWNGHPAPAPSPKFSRTESIVKQAETEKGAYTDQILSEAGLSLDTIAAWRRKGVIA